MLRLRARPSRATVPQQTALVEGAHQVPRKLVEVGPGRFGAGDHHQVCRGEVHAPEDLAQAAPYPIAHNGVAHFFGNDDAHPNFTVAGGQPAYRQQTSAARASPAQAAERRVAL